MTCFLTQVKLVFLLVWFYSD